MCCYAPTRFSLLHVARVRGDSKTVNKRCTSHVLCCCCLQWIEEGQDLTEYEFALMLEGLGADPSVTFEQYKGAHGWGNWVRGADSTAMFGQHKDER